MLHASLNKGMIETCSMPPHIMHDSIEKIALCHLQNMILQREMQYITV